METTIQNGFISIAGVNNMYPTDSDSTCSFI